MSLNQVAFPTRIEKKMSEKQNFHQQPFPSQVYPNTPPPAYNPPDFKKQPAPMPIQPKVYPSVNFPHFVNDNNNVSVCSEPTMATCFRCRTTGMTKTNKSFTGCQIASGVILICSFPIFGILLFAIGSDIEHKCPRCDNLIGVKKGWCC